MNEETGPPPPALSLALPAALGVILVAAMIGGTTLNIWLRYDRVGILEGEIWRLLTAHLCHLGWKHLAMNVAGLFLIWMLFGRLFSNMAWGVIMVTSALGVGGGLLLFNPDIQWYVGLSGVLHGMFLAGAIASLLAGYRMELLLLLFVVGKLAWEQLYGALPGSESFAGGYVVVDAHLYGAVAGAAAGAVLALLRRPQAQVSGG
ncbi:MAG TPA: rhombosortase [Gammaproteobacteria bacterium]|nr:rhombosortase [Gammaproteobacteria bacterium]